MKRIFLLLSFLLMGSVSGGTADAAPPAPRTLALFVTAADDAAAAEFDGVLTSTLAAQPSLQLVERAKLDAILKEVKLGLTGVTDPKEAPRIGRLAGAELLCCVDLKTDVLALRLVEAGSARILLEKQLARLADPFLNAAACREQVLAVLPGPAGPAGRMTVGVAAFLNRSPTSRSDRFERALQEAVRKRLRAEGWCTVLERQYPTALLDEADLKRFGLAKGDGADLPPADLVVVGTMEDATAEYASDKPWEIKFELGFRLRNQSTALKFTCRSDELDTAVDRIVREAARIRQQQPADAHAEPEKDFWRRHALYLVPLWAYSSLRSLPYCGSDRDKLAVREAIRAWENLLLLDGQNTEARMSLGICLLGLHHRALIWGKGEEKELAIQQSLRATHLVESAFRASPTRQYASAYCHVAQALAIGLPARAAEMDRYIVANAALFTEADLKYARLRLAEVHKESLFEAIDKAVLRAEGDREMLVQLFLKLQWNQKITAHEAIAFAGRYSAFPDPLVRFLAEYATAERLFRDQKDVTALKHYDRAIEVQEDAYVLADRPAREVVDGIHWSRYIACKVLVNQVEAEKMLRTSAQYFRSVGRFNFAIGWLYTHYLEDVLRRNDAAEGLRVCETLLSGQEGRFIANETPRILELKAVFSAQLAGQAIPTFNQWHLIGGTASHALYAPRMVAAAGRIWVVLQPWQSGGPAFVYRPGETSARPLAELPNDVRAVASLNGKVYFGGVKGLYELNADGHVERRFHKGANSLPADQIVDLCSSGATLYLIFRDSEQFGVATLDPATGIVSVLAPTRRDASITDEPINHVYRAWWNVVDSQLYINTYYLYGQARSYGVNGWLLQKNGWESLPGWKKRPPQYVIREQGEALRLTVIGKEALFEFLKSGEKIICALPFPELVGESAWDERRLWVPTCAGLYEIDRKSQKATWLAYKDKVRGLSVLHHEGRLYFATDDGVYWCQVEPREENR